VWARWDGVPSLSLGQTWKPDPGAAARLRERAARIEPRVRTL